MQIVTNYTGSDFVYQGKMTNFSGTAVKYIINTRVQCYKQRTTEAVITLTPHLSTPA